MKCSYLKKCSLAKTCTAVDRMSKEELKGYFGFEWHYKQGYCTSKNGHFYDDCIFYDYVSHNKCVWSVS